PRFARSGAGEISRSHTLTSKSVQRTYEHAITEFVEWYCFYSERMATIGWTEAARRAGTRLATTAMSTATAAPTTYDKYSTLLSGMPIFSTPLRRMRAAVRMTPMTTPGSTSFTTSNKTMPST